MMATVMLETGPVEVSVIHVDGTNAMVSDNEGNGYWVALSDIEVTEDTLDA